MTFDSDVQARLSVGGQEMLLEQDLAQALAILMSSTPQCVTVRQMASMLLATHRQTQEMLRILNDRYCLTIEAVRARGIRLVAPGFDIGRLQALQLQSYVAAMLPVWHI